MLRRSLVHVSEGQATLYVGLQDGSQPHKRALIGSQVMKSNDALSLLAVTTPLPPQYPCVLQ